MNWKSEFSLTGPAVNYFLKLALTAVMCTVLLAIAPQRLAGKECEVQ